MEHYEAWARTVTTANNKQFLALQHLAKVCDSGGQVRTDTQGASGGLLAALTATPGLDTPKSAQRALDGLAANGLITRYRDPDKYAYVYVLKGPRQ